jgi:hypothetical protein
MVEVVATEVARAVMVVVTEAAATVVARAAMAAATMVTVVAAMVDREVSVSGQIIFLITRYSLEQVI